MEFSRYVVGVVPQPVQVPFELKSRSYTYTPDFLVYFRMSEDASWDYCRPLLAEVKPRAEWAKHWRSWLPKWKAARRMAKEQGWDFRIYDESRIRDAALANIVFLERYKRMVFPIEESRWVIANLAQMGSAPFHYILARHFMGMYRAEGIAHIWHLLATRQLECDITRPLNDQTELWVSDEYSI